MTQNRTVQSAKAKQVAVLKERKATLREEMKTLKAEKVALLQQIEALKAEKKQLQDAYKAAIKAGNTEEMKVLFQQLMDMPKRFDGFVLSLSKKTAELAEAAESYKKVEATLVALNGGKTASRSGPAIPLGGLASTTPAPAATVAQPAAAPQPKRSTGAPFIVPAAVPVVQSPTVSNAAPDATITPAAEATAPGHAPAAPAVQATPEEVKALFEAQAKELARAEMAWNNIDSELSKITSMLESIEALLDAKDIELDAIIEELEAQEEQLETVVAAAEVSAEAEQTNPDQNTLKSEIAGFRASGGAGNVSLKGSKTSAPKAEEPKAQTLQIAPTGEEQVDKTYAQRRAEATDIVEIKEEQTGSELKVPQDRVSQPAEKPKRVGFGFLGGLFGAKKEPEASAAPQPAADVQPEAPDAEEVAVTEVAAPQESKKPAGNVTHAPGDWRLAAANVADISDDDFFNGLTDPSISDEGIIAQKETPAEQPAPEVRAEAPVMVAEASAEVATVSVADRSEALRASLEAIHSNEADLEAEPVAEASAAPNDFYSTRPTEEETLEVPASEAAVYQYAPKAPVSKGAYVAGIAGVLGLVGGFMLFSNGNAATGKTEAVEATKFQGKLSSGLTGPAVKADSEDAKLMERVSTPGYEVPGLRKATLPDMTGAINQRISANEMAGEVIPQESPKKYTITVIDKTARHGLNGEKLPDSDDRDM